MDRLLNKGPYRRVNISDFISVTFPARSFGHQPEDSMACQYRAPVRSCRTFIQTLFLLYSAIPHPGGISDL